MDPKHWKQWRNIHARFYSPKLGRFISADTIVPGASNPQAWDRYSYVGNNPLRYSDPSGHKPCDEEKGCGGNSTTPRTPNPSPDEDRHHGRHHNDDIIERPKPPAYEPSSLAPACTLDNAQSYSQPPLMDPYELDYISFTLNGGEVVGGTLVLTRDRYNRVYLGFGANVGKSLTPISGSLTRGWIGDPFDNHYPSKNDTRSFLEELAINVSAGVLGGGGVTFSPGSNTSVLGYETGIYSPQIGGSAVFSGLLLDY